MYNLLVIHGSESGIQLVKHAFSMLSSIYEDGMSFFGKIDSRKEICDIEKWRQVLFTWADVKTNVGFAFGSGEVDLFDGSLVCAEMSHSSEMLAIAVQESLGNWWFESILKDQKVFYAYICESVKEPLKCANCLGGFGVEPYHRKEYQQWGSRGLDKSLWREGEVRKMAVRNYFGDLAVNAGLIEPNQANIWLDAEE